MKIYIDPKDIGVTISYKWENGKKQYLYAHDKQGFEISTLEDKTKMVCNRIREEFDKPKSNGANQQQISLSKVLKFLNKIENEEKADVRMKKCDFCTQCDQNGKCVWTLQGLRQEHCKKAIKLMVKALGKEK